MELAREERVRVWLQQGLPDEPAAVACGLAIAAATQPVMLLDPHNVVTAWLRASTGHRHAPHQAELHEHHASSHGPEEVAQAERLTSGGGALLLTHVEELHGRPLPRAWAALLRRRRPGAVHPQFRLYLSSAARSTSAAALLLPPAHLKLVMVITCT